jgi:hypothetical protein
MKIMLVQQLINGKGKYTFRCRCGIGIKALNRYVELALQSGYPVVVIKQTGYVLTHVAERKLAVQYILIGKMKK